jgi:ribosomal-protein-alanine N-acetyltransferase
MGLYLTGTKVRLRPLETDLHFKYLFELTNDPETSGDYVNFMASSWDSFNSFIHDLPKSPDELTFFLIADNQKDAIIGFVNHLYPRPMIKSTIEIGFQLRPRFRNKGYATEAVALLVDYLFSNRPIERIEAITDIDNLPSQKVLEKNEFKKEGTLRNSYFSRGEYRSGLIYSLLREEWRA